MAADPPDVPFLDLARAVAAERAELASALQRVLARGAFILGPECQAFEEELAAWTGTAHAVAVASGTDAIELALRALGVGAGDEVVTQASTCVPTVAAIARAGAVPVVCDADPATGLMSPTSLQRACGPRTRAVIPVHLYGQCADVDAIAEIATAHGAAVLEDCAQAHGARVGDRPAGTIGVAGCFSFYPTKNLGALGDAGAIVTSDDHLAARLRQLRQYGQGERYHHGSVGVNSRMDELQAAVLRVRLRRLDAGNERRRAIAATYRAALDGSPVRPLAVLPGRVHANHLFVVRARDRDALREDLARRGVGTLVHYPVPIHLHPPYRETRRAGVPLDGAETLAREVVSLPLHPALTDAEVAHVAQAARAAADQLQ